MMVDCIMGIDPGVTGGIAFYYPDNPGHVIAEDIPVVAGEVDTDALATRVKQIRPTLAYIERASSMPGQGVASTFKFGAAYGALRATLSVMAVPHAIVSPQVWKRHFGLDKDKEKSRAMAKRIWPGVAVFDRKKDHGRAEAALIALYASQTRRAA